MGVPLKGPNEPLSLRLRAAFTEPIARGLGESRAFAEGLAQIDHGNGWESFVGERAVVRQLASGIAKEWPIRA